jgi:hypothetical protein
MGSLLKHLNGSRELPRYQSHKIVWALKIKLVVPELKGQATIYPYEEGYHPFLVSAEYVRKHQPSSGGYYVLYADGYESWSPQVQFEDGNSPIETAKIGNKYQAILTIDSKYGIKLEGAKLVICKIDNGEPLPNDEPKILFRAQDALAIGALERYLADCTAAKCPQAHLVGVQRIIEEFGQFSSKYPHLMKDRPGTRRVRQVITPPLDEGDFVDPDA